MPVVANAVGAVTTVEQIKVAALAAQHDVVTCTAAISVARAFELASAEPQQVGAGAAVERVRAFVTGNRVAPAATGDAVVALAAAQNRVAVESIVTGLTISVVGVDGVASRIRVPVMRTGGAEQLRARPNGAVGEAQFLDTEIERIVGMRHGDFDRLAGVAPGDGKHRGEHAGRKADVQIRRARAAVRRMGVALHLHQLIRPAIDEPGRVDAGGQIDAIEAAKPGLVARNGSGIACAKKGKPTTVDDRIGASTGEQHVMVVAVAAVEHVVIGAAYENVIVAASGERVVASAPDQQTAVHAPHVVHAGGFVHDQRVVACTAVDNAASDDRNVVGIEITIDSRRVGQKAVSDLPPAFELRNQRGNVRNRIERAQANIRRKRHRTLTIAVVEGPPGRTACGKAVRKRDVVGGAAHGEHKVVATARKRQVCPALSHAQGIAASRVNDHIATIRVGKLHLVDVVASTAPKQIVTRTAYECVAVVATVQRIVAISAIERVGSAPTIKRIVASIAAHGVVATKAINAITACRDIEALKLRIVAVGAKNIQALRQYVFPQQYAPVGEAHLGKEWLGQCGNEVDRAVAKRQGIFDIGWVAETAARRQ